MMGIPTDVPFQLMVITFAVKVPVPEMEKLPEKDCVGMLILFVLQSSVAVTGTP